jgi:hypothetical protein
VKSDFLTELDGPIYEKARVRLPLMLRLDAAFSDGGATYHHGVITVEHVMPKILSWTALGSQCLRTTKSVISGRIVWGIWCC